MTDGHAQDHGWRGLLLSSDMTPTARSVHDALVLFEHHPDMRGRLRYNAFTKQAMTGSALPWHTGGYQYPRPLDDADGMMAAGWAEEKGLMKVSVGTFKECLVTVAKKYPYNPLVDWLHGIEWDQEPRIDMWLVNYLGAIYQEYLTHVGPKFLIGAVARALKPGEKVDTMLILEGPQGRFKSTAARTLFGVDWYTDDLADFHSKDAALQMQGKWGIEMSELASMSKAEANRTKAILSRQIDRFRAPYDRFVAEHPRQCVFIGTTNPIDGYFKDPTGSRRFWPVRCGEIKLPALTADREQLWAEAVFRYERGDKWWLENSEVDLAKLEQDKRRETDPWELVIEKKLGSQTWAIVSHVMTDWLNLPIEKQDKSTQMRVASYFRSLGWERRKKRINGNPEWIWSAPHSDVLDATDFSSQLAEFPPGYGGEGTENEWDFNDVPTVP
jgi:predicted P-loop ATPase